MCSEVTDFVAVCGEGALGCEGSTRYPKCVCDNDQSFIASSNGQQCILGNSFIIDIQIFNFIIICNFLINWLNKLINLDF